LGFDRIAAVMIGYLAFISPVFSDNRPFLAVRLLNPFASTRFRRQIVAGIFAGTMQ
jgi:hypothetical protein